MYPYKNLEIAFQMNIIIKKNKSIIYKSSLPFLEKSFDYLVGLYTITTSKELSAEILELFRMVIESNEELQPFWVRVIKQMRYDCSEIPTAFLKPSEMCVLLLKGQKIVADISLVAALFGQSEVLPVNSNTLMVIYLASDEIVSKDIVAHIESEGFRNIKLIQGKTVMTIDELKDSYESALLIDSLNFFFEKNIIIYEEILVENLIGKVPLGDRTSLANSYNEIYPIHQLNEELTETVYGFFKHNLNITDTANDLFLHRNTLIYRLNKIYQISRLDIRNFEDAVKMKILLLLNNIK